MSAEGSSPSGQRPAAARDDVAAARDDMAAVRDDVAAARDDMAAARDDVAAAMARHPVRAALLELLAHRESVTATEAAGQLGGSSGLHSFHLRQLARYGLVEEVGGRPGRSRPWRLTGTVPAGAGPGRAGSAAAASDLGGSSGQLGRLARGLEDESYQRWLAGRDDAPRQWRRDEAFSEVLYLTPRELTELGAAVRALIAGYRPRERFAARRPPGAAPVAVVARLFPLLEPQGPQSGG